MPAAVTRIAEPMALSSHDGQGRIPQNANVATNANVTNVATTVNVGGPNILITTRKQQVPFVVRAIWFCLIGFWLSLVFILVGYLCCLTVVLTPVGFWFLNRIPQAQTLRLRNTEFHATQKDGITHLAEGNVQQIPWYYRALYFPIGLVLGLGWLTLAWL
ncbi:MAG: YccF domain-containing protein, partial [Chloroflexia bacterium]|nr:YccF domain-containing protein [Chloroflexia bacterium]